MSSISILLHAAINTYMNFVCLQVEITGSSLYEEVGQKGELFHGLPQTCIVHDLHCMTVLLLQVNIVPIIAKADTVAKSELKQFKEKVRETLVKERKSCGKVGDSCGVVILLVVYINIRFSLMDYTVRQ